MRDQKGRSHKSGAPAYSSLQARQTPRNYAVSIAGKRALRRTLNAVLTSVRLIDGNNRLGFALAPLDRVFRTATTTIWHGGASASPCFIGNTHTLRFAEEPCSEFAHFGLRSSISILDSNGFARPASLQIRRGITPPPVSEAMRILKNIA
jgi:hypothetical protein